MARRAKRNAVKPLVFFECGSAMGVYFSRALIEERETFRRLAHRVVDLVVDAGRHEWLAGNAAYSLSRLAEDDIVKTATKLVHDARAEAKESHRR